MNILLIVALNLILYVRTMKFLLIADDLGWYQRYREKGWCSFKKVIENRRWFYLQKFLFERFYGGFTFGRNVSFDHLFTTFLHTIICVMIYTAFGSNTVSFWAAILYSVNPINNQTSIWLNGRRYAINIILVLGIIMTSGLKTGWAYAGLFYWLTTFFQVTAFFAPVLLLWKYPIILLGIPIFWFIKGDTIIKKVRQRYEKVKDADRREFKLNRLTIITKVYGHYFFKMFFPGVCAMTYPLLHFWGQTEKGNKDAYALNLHFYRGVVAIVISVAGLGLFAYSHDYKMLCFWAFMCLSLLQWCHIVPIVQDLADRYANVPNVFAMFFLSYFVHQYAGPYAMVILACFASYYIPNLITVMRMYRSEGMRWTYQRYYFPWLPAPLKFEVEWLIHDRKDYPRAWVLIQEFLKYGNDDFTILYQAAKCHQAVGKNAEAYNLVMRASKNYHIGQLEHESKLVENFIKNLTLGQPSRQVKRAEERKLKSSADGHQGKK